MAQTSPTQAVRRHSLPTGKRLVLKVGTSTLMGPSGPDRLLMGRLADVLACLHRAGNQVVLVTSGAVGTGCWRLGEDAGARSVPERQAAAAAVGQGILMHMYDRAFAERGLMSAQLLLTRDDLADRERYMLARKTLSVLLEGEAPVIPVVNENDSVTLDELTFGDNDRLSALVADLVGADALFILSDVDGLYDDDPRSNPLAQRIDVVDEVTAEIEALAGESGSLLGTGGMATKVAAAKIATACGIPVTLLDGGEPELVLQCLTGAAAGTHFLAGPCQMERKERWMALHAQVAGQLYLDETGLKAVRSETASLLPSGVRKVKGTFGPGDLVSLLDGNGEEIGRGLINYGSNDMQRIRGHEPDEIAELLGHKPHNEAISRHNMVVI